MIGWLQGRLAEPWQQANRCGVLLVCQGVGYEVQLSPRHWQRLPPAGSDLELHVHHIVREDGASLYGFTARAERDLFRELVGVSGVGPQMALGLLGSLETPELVRAIVQGDLRRLTQAPGVGKRTAERLAVELRARLQERFPHLAGLAGHEAEAAIGGMDAPAGADGEIEEVRTTLAALGYESLEIHRALRAAAGEGLAGADAEEWIRCCLRWLSRAAA
ncbi:MAG: Holliday junction branch migration protein RuvA [Synechococcaceae cyanobacterium]|nr:Holliday junction branch migration protein RuvA [Synechococcaceae cyanobacterium]